MNIESYRAFCLAKKGVTEELPFGPDTLVFKVMGKMFSATNVAQFTSVNLKCDPERAIELRETYAEVQPGYHMSKKHWNTIDMHGSLHDDFIVELIEHSYNLVVSGLTKKLRAELETLEGN